jgi:hypothetical protein
MRQILTETTPLSCADSTLGKLSGWVVADRDGLLLSP